MPITRISLDKDNQVEGFEQGVDHNADAPDVRGIYFQNDTSNDVGVVITRDASNNLTFTDPVLALTKTLTQLAAASSAVAYTEFLLNNEPTAETGVTDAAYTVTRSAAFLVTNETWKRSDATTIKTVDYVYTSSFVSSEVRKVFAANGTTIVAQVTWTYVYTAGFIVSSTMNRDV